MCYDSWRGVSSNHTVAVKKYGTAFSDVYRVGDYATAQPWWLHQMNPTKARSIVMRRGWIQMATRVPKRLWVAAKLQAIAENVTLEELLTEALEEHLARSVGPSDAPSARANGAVGRGRTDRTRR